MSERLGEIMKASSADFSFVNGPDAMLAGFLHDWADENFVERDGKLYWRGTKAERKRKKRKKKRILSKSTAGKKPKF